MPTDLVKARKIIAKRERWVGPFGELPENIARAVAEGIALGRKEGLESAQRQRKNLIDVQIRASGSV
jgi:hypothetical protein